MATNSDNNKSFLGRGWTFPPTFSKYKQSVEMLEGEEDIMSSLRILVSTSLGERAMRSKYGTRVADMIFEPFDNSQAAILKADITDAIYLHEPRIRPVKVEVEVDDLEGRVEIQVEFRIVATNTRRNFVYPFYQLEGTEIKQ